MSKILLQIRYLAEYLFAMTAYVLLKIQPRFVIRIFANMAGSLAYLFPPVYKLIEANIKTCFPEKTDREVKKIGRASMVNAIRNMLEFFWMSNNDRRIRRCLFHTERAKKLTQECIKNNERIVFVNPHIGSWEGSALSVPYYLDTPIAAVANPLKNPYLNKLFNSGNRKQVKGLEVIFSKGAVRASIKALKNGSSIGILIDQNTKVREGGTFVNFFGLPVPCSKAPAEFYRACKHDNVKVKVYFGISLRGEDNILRADCIPLSKPENEYEPAEMIQELISISEEFIRKNPEHYIWLYKRFAHIPQGIDEELVKRYPYYSKKVKNSFYSRKKQFNVMDYLPKDLAK